MKGNNYTPKCSTGEYTLATAAAVCTLIEPIAENYGFHVALTGGCLYGSGGRKDIDIVFYSIRGSVFPTRPRIKAMWKALLKGADLHLDADHGFVKKAHLGTDEPTIPLDLMFPEEVEGTYCGS